MSLRPLTLTAVAVFLLRCDGAAFADAPPFSDYCHRLEQQIQGRKHGFLAGNVAYYVGGFHASWELKEHETLGLTHPFHHDLRSRGVGLLQSRGRGADDTGRGNDFSGWEFYKDTRVLYGSVVRNGKTHRHPTPKKMFWRPDRIICEYDVDGVQLREEKFIAANDAACTIITASRPVTLRFSGQSFFGRNSLTSTATIAYDEPRNAIHIVEGGTTKCRPETDRSDRIGPIMYEGMSTVLASSRNFAASHQFATGEHGEQEYEFEVPCDSNPLVLVWTMHDEYRQALKNATDVLRDPRAMMLAKTRDMNRQLNEEIPWFRCSDRVIEDIYYYLWSLYLMYYIDVQHGWEMEPHTQTAVNNFLGMHRYDATFQIRVGAWTANKSHYAVGNVLTWKHLYRNGHYRRSPNGVISLADNKGTTWHSGVYGGELSEHVLGAWQIYQHTGDVQFLRDCYEGYFREVFRERIASFFSNQFEVAETLTAMARVTGHDEDIELWKRLVPFDAKQRTHWFKQRWEANGHRHFFAGPDNGMLMTTGFWHLRSKYFPREYASEMVATWALDREQGFYGDFFPLAMSRRSMKTFASKVDHSFGYTPDTAYFTLSGMFRQRLSDAAWRLTLNHLEHYNFNRDWKIPVAPEAYTRSGRLFGDQYSNFNAGKLLLYLEGLAGLEYTIPENRFVVHDTMPPTWKWMEVRIPIQLPNEGLAPARDEPMTRWPVVRYERRENADSLTKTIRVSDCPFPIVIEPWTEHKRVIRFDAQPGPARADATMRFSHYRRFVFSKTASDAVVQLQLSPETDPR